VCILKVAFKIVDNTMKKEILIKFGKKVREIRIKQNLSQEKLATKAGVHRTYIGMIERAEKNITLENIEKVAKALGLSVKELFN
jgi:transcriptional regulator with XRE-family HTH domain